MLWCWNLTIQKWMFNLCLSHLHHASCVSTSAPSSIVCLSFTHPWNVIYSCVSSNLCPWEGESRTNMRPPETRYHTHPSTFTERKEIKAERRGHEAEEGRYTNHNVWMISVCSENVIMNPFLMTCWCESAAGWKTRKNRCLISTWTRLSGATSRHVCLFHVC